MRCPRLTTQLLRAIEDALIHRMECARDVESLEESDYVAAQAWVGVQLDRRRAAPRVHAPIKTPLELWLEKHPREPTR